MSKIYEDRKYKFVCNGCRLVAGVHPSEQSALKMARRVAKAQGWVWKHPHWQLYCPNCK